MKKLLSLSAAIVAIGLAGGSTAPAEEKKAENAKPYPLNTCIVSDEELGGHGKPYVFTHNGQELKLCCKPCLKDFNKEPAKYLKKLEKPAKKK